MRLRRKHDAAQPGIDPPMLLGVDGDEHAVVYREGEDADNGGNADNFVYVDFIHNEKSKGLITQDIAKLLNHERLTSCRVAPTALGRKKRRR